MRILTYGFVLYVALCATNLLCAQNKPKPTKMGYANANYILSLLPESKMMESDLKAYESQLKKRLDSKILEYRQKGEDLQNNYTDITELERSDKQQELVTMEQSIMKFQQEAETSMQKKQEELLEPVLDKVQAAIDAIAKRDQYRYIFKAEALLYATDAEDISDIVLRELGVQTPPSSK